MVQAALESRAACTTTAGHIEVEPADEIKIRLKHCGQCLFLQSMLSASIFKWIFDFRIGIPNIHISYFHLLDSSFFCHWQNMYIFILHHQWVIFCSRQKSIPNSQVDEWNQMILRVIWWWSEASGAMIDSIPLPSRQSTRRMLPKMGSYLVVLFTELVED